MYVYVYYIGRPFAYMAPVLVEEFGAPAKDLFRFGF